MWKRKNEFKVKMQKEKNGFSLLVYIRLRVENGRVEEALEPGSMKTMMMLCFYVKQFRAVGETLEVSTRA